MAAPSASTRLEFAVQDRPGGIAEALGITEAFADGAPIVIMLADNLLERSLVRHGEASRRTPPALGSS